MKNLEIILIRIKNINVIEKKFFNVIMIIGDNMARVNLIDMNFKNMSIEDKRTVLVLLDFSLKRLHLKNLIVTDFDPKNIYCEDGLYYFGKVTSNPIYYADNMEEAVFKNILSLSNLAFCTYLPDYDISQGLLSHNVVSTYFNSTSSYLPEDDRNYYKSILVDSYKEKKLIGDSIYFYDYINKKVKSEAGKGNSNKLVKATETGKSLANNEESAFSMNFFLITLVACVTVLLIGLFGYFMLV